MCVVKNKFLFLGALLFLASALEAFCQGKYALAGITLCYAVSNFIMSLM
jgi:hypothetical protein